MRTAFVEWQVKINVRCRPLKHCMGKHLVHCASHEDIRHDTLHTWSVAANETDSKTDLNTCCLTLFGTTGVLMIYLPHSALVTIIIIYHRASVYITQKHYLIWLEKWPDQIDYHLSWTFPYFSELNALLNIDWLFFSEMCLAAPSLKRWNAYGAYIFHFHFICFALNITSQKHKINCKAIRILYAWAAPVEQQRS